GTIADIFPQGKTPALDHLSYTLDAQGALAMPGLIDLHIHGFAGYGPELGTPEALWQMSEALAKQGVCAFCPTLYCAHASVLKEQLARLAPAIGSEKGARILGFHLEGPFISPHKPGVMKPQDILPADLSMLEELYAAAGGKIVALTFAPELEGSTALLDFCREHHILPQAGHTNATYEEFMQSVLNGMTHATHAFNAMSPFTQRAPGAAGAVLMCPEVSCEIIADGIHVHPAIVSFLRTVKATDKIILVTDALLPTTQEKGPFKANGEIVSLENGVWKRTEDGVIAGSALTMLQGIKNLVEFGYPLPQAVRCATWNPAQLLHLPKTGQLAPGFTADITLVRPDFSLQAVFIRGQQLV
ncbi:MAG: N-acetylglucosamine-6-phosphate deacetylase, partial [Elusimicrobiaceae bacterium]|nr:N-acetylglucosamine-6-phosphate deacetylase [Elusimicrobiaceae bacterium]